MKLLVHAIDGVGLGHLSRTLTLAKELKKSRPNLDIVFVTNSKFPELIKKSGFKFYTIELDTKSVLENEVSYREYLKKNFNSIKKIILNESPNAVLFDSEINEEIINLCKKQKTKTIFILRNVTKEKFKDIVKTNLLQDFDLILVPQIKKQTLYKDYLEKLKNVHFTGPILKETLNQEKIIPKNKNKINILISFSAGANIVFNKPLFFPACSDHLQGGADNSPAVPVNDYYL